MRAARGALGTAVIAFAAPVALAPSAMAAKEGCSPDQVYYEKSTPSYPYVALDGERLAGIATGRGVTVAVVDSGITDRNAHLKGAVVPGFSAVAGDASRGRTDTFAHGTSVAGVIGARPVKDSLLVGLAPGVDLMPIRVYVGKDAAPATTGTIAAGVRWAAEHGADVINISLTTGRDDKVLADAIAFALAKDAVVVAAAGNQEPGEPDGVRYPAAYDGVIGVAATNTSGAVVQANSITGPHIDVTAPGSGVLTTFLASGDCLLDGGPYSSYATGYVSGLAALLREKFPDESQEEIAYRILAGADGTQDGTADEINGWGAIQPRQSLTMLLDAPRSGPPKPGEEAAPAAGSGKAAQVVELRARADDPLAPARRNLVWWAVLGTGGVAIALVTRPWLGRLRRSST